MKGSLARGSYYSLREIHDCMLAQDRFKVVVHYFENHECYFSGSSVNLEFCFVES